MSRPNPLLLLAVLAIAVVALGGAGILKGGLFIGRHEGDMYHLIDILFRMEAGQRPHLDFLTPIGIGAFWPIAALLKAGLSIDQAILWAQAGLAAALLPALWWTAYSRFQGVLAYGFGLYGIALLVALVHGGPQDIVSVSMHYNRWSWALAYIAVALAALPSLGRPLPWLDGTLIGLAGVGLLLIKVTYAVAFGPVVLAMLLIRGARRTLVSALIAAFIALVWFTLAFGIGHWTAYIGDLLLVATGDIRPKPDLAFDRTLIAPTYIGTSFAALYAVILLRQGGADRGGLFLLLLLPASAYVTYQNFGNDPQWVVLFALLALTFATGLDEEAAVQRRRLSFAVTVILALGLPSVFNMVYSPIRHALVPVEDHSPLLPTSDRHAGFQTRTFRAVKVDLQIPYDGDGTGLEALRPLAEREDPIEFKGEILDECEILSGLQGLFSTVAADLKASGVVDGQSVYVADLFSVNWLFGAGEPVLGAAPWYYGGLPGYANADLLLVPFCPIQPGVRQDILERIEADGRPLTEIRRTPLYILLSIG
ncbi:MAG: hypothetical protein AAF871_04590 [Pseudomonadota bacterium]